MTSPLERGKRRAAERQRHAEMVFAKQLTEQLDVESLLMEKIEQKTRGGIRGLRHAFRNFNTSYDQTEISFPQFKENLVRFGLPGLPEEESYKLFVKYDDDGGGTIDFEEFVGHLMKTYKSRSEIGEHQHDIQHAKRARDKMVQQRRQAERLKWQTLNVDAENLLLQKIEERVKGGGNSLRLAFRKFKTSSAELDITEFQSTLEKIGLQGLNKDQVRKLFAKFDADGNGTIEFNEFIDFVMNCQLQMSRSNQENFFRDRHKDGLNKAANRVCSNENAAVAHFSTGERVEAVIVEKLQQYTRNGIHAIRKIFLHQPTTSHTYFQSTSVPKPEKLSVDDLKHGLQKLGLFDVPEVSLNKCFELYQPKDGFAEFDFFAKRILRSLVPLQNPFERETAHNRGIQSKYQHQGLLTKHRHKMRKKARNQVKCTRYLPVKGPPSQRTGRHTSNEEEENMLVPSARSTARAFLPPCTAQPKTSGRSATSKVNQFSTRSFRASQRGSKEYSKRTNVTSRATRNSSISPEGFPPPVVVQHNTYNKISKFGTEDVPPW